MSEHSQKRLIIGISGASGVIYGIRLLQTLGTLPDHLKPETHLIMSRSAEITLAHESDLKVIDVHESADVVHSNKDIGAAVASGSYQTIGMIIAPCSMKTLAQIATGVTDSLLSRAADVVLKERRKLVCMVRETPLHSGHLKSMLQISEMGGIIAPPDPAFYNKPKTLQDVVDHTVGRILDLFQIETGLVKRWRDSDAKAKSIF